MIDKCSFTVLDTHTKKNSEKKTESFFLSLP